MSEAERGGGGNIHTLRLPATLEGALRSGHPWIYRDHITRTALPAGGLSSGAVVRVEAGAAASFGVYDTEGAIAVRLFGERPEPKLLKKRVAQAVALRAHLPVSDSDAYRLLNGEGDYLPGIVADRYGRHIIMRAYSPGVETLTGEVSLALASHMQGGEAPLGHVRGIALRAQGRGGEPEHGAAEAGDSLTALWGELPPPELTVTENGLKFIADPWRGQKTGLFLDQRENRQLVRRFAGGKRVLNLFAYNGGFSVYALAGGARSVVSVDIAKLALEAAERNVQMNDLKGDHSALAADIFEALPRWVRQEQRYGAVIVDPPSLANSAAQRRRALRAYLRLNRDAFQLVEEGGLLATGSCTAQVSPEQFREVVAEAARAAGVRAQIITENGQPADHPVPVSFPEGRYLKFMLLRVLP